MARRTARRTSCRGNSGASRSSGRITGTKTNRDPAPRRLVGGSRVLPVQAGDLRRADVALVNHHAITETDYLAAFHGHTAVPRFVSREIANAEDVRGKQAVRTRVPVCGAPRVAWIVEDGDPHRPAVHRAIVVHPRRTLAPDVFLRLLAFGVDHAPALILGHRGGETDSKRTFLGGAEGESFDGPDLDFVVDGSQPRIRVEADGAGFGHDRVALRIDPVEDGADRARLAAAPGIRRVLERHAAHVRDVRAWLGGPKIRPVDVAVGEEEAALVGVIVRLAGKRLHREMPRDDGARSGAQRVEVRLIPIG